VLCLLIGGAVSDRLERRRVLLVANVAEAVAIGLIGILALSGALTLWMLLVLVAIYGSAEASSHAWVIGLIPLSFAITGPLAQAIGARATLLWAGGLGAGERKVESNPSSPAS
jgi:MFS family permease